MRSFLFLLFLLSISSAIIIGPRIYEQEDFGDISLEEFTYSLSVDCSNGQINAIVMDGNNTPVGGADTYLRYVDYAQPLISSTETLGDGTAVHDLPGKVSFMRGLFILVIHKDGFRGKEVHFDILGCLTNQTWIPPPPPVVSPPPPPVRNATNASLPQQNQTVPDITNDTTGENGTEALADEAEEDAAPYIAGIFVSLTILLVAIYLWKVKR